MTRRVLGALTASILLLTSGCGFSNHTATEQGQYQIRVQWPKTPSDFRIQVIPEDTVKIELEVAGAGLDAPISRTLDKGESERLVLILPQGPKRIQATAFNADDQIVAEAQEEAIVKANLTVQSTLELTPVEPEPEPTPTATPRPNSGGGGSSGGESGGSNSTPDGGSDPGPEIVGGGGGSGDSSGDGSETGDTPTSDTPSPIPGTNLVESSLLTSSGGGGGGGGGGSSSVGNIVITELANSETSVSGLGYPAELKVAVDNPNALSDSNYKWSCSPTDDCGTFDRTDGPRVIWFAPTSPPPVTSPATYTITIEIVDNDGSVITSESVEIDMEFGTQTVTVNDGGINQ